MTPTEYKSLRQQVGTQQQAAALLGVTRQLISAREKGGARITEEAAIAIRNLAPPAKKLPRPRR